MDEGPEGIPAGTEVRTHFVRGRNALVARATLTELFVDHYLHASRHHLHPAPEHDALLKDALAALLLHCASRPRNEIVAWTINFQAPRLNLFLGGDNEDCTVVGRIYAENVKEGAENLFFADVVRNRQQPRRSGVAFAGADAFRAVEAFYARSEQRPARYFRLGEEDAAMVSSHPDCDLAWFEALTADTVRGLDRRETLALIERRTYRWECGCDQEKIHRVLAPVMRSDPESLFEGEETIEVQCPRCAARYRVTREAMEAYVVGHG